MIETYTQLLLSFSKDNLKALLRKADLRQNVGLQDGDSVYVPRMRIGDINNWIENITPLLDIVLWPGEFDTRYFENRALFISGSN